MGFLSFIPVIGPALDKAASKVADMMGLGQLKAAFDKVGSLVSMVGAFSNPLTAASALGAVNDVFNVLGNKDKTSQPAKGGAADGILGTLSSVTKFFQ